jgi:PAS domain S-box-containing protein
MGWIGILWPMVGAASLTLGLICLLVWARQPRQYAYALFFATAASVAAFNVVELRMMRTADPDAYAVLVRWAHVPLSVMFPCIVGFVQASFRSGRMWLGVAACATRAAALVLNFTTGVNVNALAVSAMLPVALWGGETVFVPVPVPNPWAVVAQLSNLLLIAFVADASVRLWRRGDGRARRRAGVVGGTMVICFLIGAILGGLINLGLLHAPAMFSFVFLGVMFAMAYDLGWDLIAAAQLAERLRASEQRLQLAAAGAGLALWEWDIVRDDIWTTDRGRMLFGYGPTERVDIRRFLKSVHPDDRPALERAMGKSVSAGDREVERDFRVRLEDGRVRWVSSSGVIERDERGAALRMRGVSQDITARKLAEERFRLLVESVPSAILMADADGTIVLANNRVGAVFGYSPAELPGRPVEMLIPARYHQAHRGHRQAYGRDPSARAMGAGRELLATRKDGAEVPVEVGISPIRTSEGLFVLASVVDISARRQSERDAARLRDEIAHLSRVAMLGELSGALAHEINQPLSAVLSNAQAAQRFLSRDPPSAPQVAEILVDVVSSAKRASDVVTRLRSLLRKEDVQHLPLALNDVVEDVLVLMRHELDHRSTALRTELDSLLPAVLGDRVQLQQVLLNLVINGCDAMNGSAAPRELVVRTAAGADGSVELCVADRGEGIPPESLERIFEPFVTTKAHGLGLGLAVCRSIVQAHGGRLWATNNPERGATLHVQLPAAHP